MVEKRVGVRLSLEDKLTGGLRGSLSRIRRFSSLASRTLGGLNRSVFTLRNAFVGLAGVGLTGFAAKLVADSAAAQTELGQLARRLGLSTEFLSEFSFAARQAGVDTGTTATALQRLSRRLGEIRQSGGTKGTALEAVRELGLLDEVLRGDGLEKLIPKIADGLSQVRDESRRLALNFKLVDSEGAKLLQLLTLGAAGIERFRERARALGLTLGTEAAANAEQFTGQLGELVGALGGLGVEFADRSLPKITSGLASLTATIEENRESIVRAIDDIAGAFERLSGFGRLVARPGAIFGALDFGTPLVDSLTSRSRGAGSTGAPPGIQGPITEAEARRLRGVVGDVEELGKRLGSAAGAQEKLGDATEVADGRFADFSFTLRGAIARDIEDLRQNADDLNNSLLGMQAGLVDLQRQFSKFAQSRILVNRLGNAISDSIVDSIDDAVKGTFRLRAALLNLLGDVRRALTRSLVNQLIGTLLGNVSGGGGGNQNLPPIRVQGNVQTLSGQGVQQSGSSSASGRPSGVQGPLREDGSFQGGGVVTGSRPVRALLHPPEAVVPLESGRIPVKLTGARAQSTNVTVNNVSINATDAESFRNMFNAQALESRELIADTVASETRRRPGLRSQMG